MTKLKKSTKKFLKNKLQHKQPAKKALPPAKSKSKRKPLAKAKAKVPGSQDPEQQQQQQLLQDDAYNLGILSDEEGDDDDDALDSLDDADHQDDSNEEEDDGVSEDDADLDAADDDDDDEESDLEDHVDHKAQLEALKESDPDFYKFMLENDKELLNFNVSEDEDDGDDDKELEADQKHASMETDADADDDDEEMLQDSQINLTVEMINKWKVAIASSKSLRTLRKLLSAFRAAVASANGEEGVDSYRYHIPSSSVFNAVMVASITYAPIVFDHHLMIKADASGEKIPGERSPKWKKLQPLVKSFLTNLLKSFKTMTSMSMIKFAIQTSYSGEYHGAMPLLACFPKLAKEYVKTVTGIWTRPSSSSQNGGSSSNSDEEKVRIVSVIALRKLVFVAPAFIDIVLKYTYSSFISVASHTTSLNLPTLEFLTTSLTELQLLSQPKAIYNHAFTNIRKLAMLLRAAINARTEESAKRVYSWNFLWSCRLWASVLAGGVEAGIGGKENILQPLIYPLVQVLLGIMRVKTSSKYFPHRFHCIKLAIRLSERTGVFIPVASYILEIFDSVEITKLGSPSTNKPLEFGSYIRASKGYIGTRVYQTGVIEQSVDLLYEYFALHATSIAFPELALPTIVHLKKYTKGVQGKNVVFSKLISALLDKLSQNRDYVLGHRSNVDFSPKDATKVELFLSDALREKAPLIKYMAAKKRVSKT